MSKPTPFSRILLKLSGESLLGAQSYGVDPAAALEMAKTLAHLSGRHTPSQATKAHPIQLGIVIGGGNWLRGNQGTVTSMARTPADQMGMLATLMNGLALQQALTQIACPARLFSALECPKVAESFTLRAATSAMQQGDICLFVGGTGHPYFTTDSAAALRACELQVDALCKATKVDGIYSADPIKYPSAQKYLEVSYKQVLKEQLGFMDMTAITLCMQQNIPIYLFNMNALTQSALVQELQEGRVGSCVSSIPS